MNPVRPDMRQPATKARLRNSPDSKKLRASPPSGPTTAVDVRNTTITSGTRMIPMVRNCRRR